MTIYNPYVGQDQAADTWPSDQGNDFAVFKFYLDQVNGSIATSAAANSIPYAQVSLAFNGSDGTTDPRSLGYIAWDGLHPNDTGHKVIADAFRKLGYSPLR